MRVGLIGYGNIGTALSGLLGDGFPLRVLVRPGRTAPGETVYDIAALLAEPRPDLVVEAAGHSAVAHMVPEVLGAGIDCVVASIGALADDALHARLISAAEAGGSRLILPAGAIGGLDLLSALRPSGITAVTYEGRKPPAAWKGSPAEALLKLDTLREPAVFYEGTAREAARDYPKNANVAAGLALAGVGFDDTKVRLIADPQAPGNVHSYRVTAGAADYAVTIEGKPSPGMARTSAATVLSLYREIRNRMGPVAV